MRIPEGEQRENKAEQHLKTSNHIFKKLREHYVRERKEQENKNLSIFFSNCKKTGNSGKHPKKRKIHHLQKNKNKNDNRHIVSNYVNKKTIERHLTSADKDKSKPKKT